MKKTIVSWLMLAVMVSETVVATGAIANTVYAEDLVLVENSADAYENVDINEDTLIEDTKEVTLNQSATMPSELVEEDYADISEESLTAENDSLVDNKTQLIDEEDYNEDSVWNFKDGFGYEYVTSGNETTIKIVNYTGRSEVVIPSEIDGVKVTEIGDRVFYCNNASLHVEIPETVTTIGDSVFSSSGIETIVIPKTIKKMGSRCFDGCKQLTSVTFLASVKEIPENTFYQCEKLKTLDIPKGVTKIGKYAFWKSGLESIKIPKNVKEIGDSAFMLCEKLNKLTIEDGVQKINDSAFADCKSIKKIVVPDSVTYIGKSAFSGCEKLENITLSKNIKAINDFTFSVDQKLKKVEIPYGVTVIKDRAFNHCDSITSLTIPSTVTKIENMAFLYCLSLKKIVIPSSVKSVGPTILFGDNKAVIYGKKGSKIEKYAKANSYRFKADNSVRLDGPGTVKKGKSIKLKLENASGTISWKSSDKNCATVNKSGVVNGKKAGTVTITATYKGKKYTKKVTVR